MLFHKGTVSLQKEYLKLSKIFFGEYVDAIGMMGSGGAAAVLSARVTSLPPAVRSILPIIVPFPG